jgi:hypothetical protein
MVSSCRLAKVSDTPASPIRQASEESPLDRVIQR